MKTNLFRVRYSLITISKDKEYDDYLEAFLNSDDTIYSDCQ